MITQQAQIKINLPVQLKDYLESKADKFGMPMAGYIKYLILRDVSEQGYPVFSVSKQAEKAYEQAKKEEEKNGLVNCDNLNKFFENM